MNSFFLTLVRRIFLAALCGCLAGLGSSAFLILLDIVTGEREGTPWLVYFLPLAGLATGLIYHYYGRGIEGGSSLVIEEINDPKKIIPAKMAPLVLLSTLMTHLFGGSAGREGTAVQIGGSFADQISRLFMLNRIERRNLLIAGTGAGFGSAIGAPWAGALFGMEVIGRGRVRFSAVVESVVASFTGYQLTLLLHAPHTRYPEIFIRGFSAKTLMYVGIAGLFFGIAVPVFIHMTHTVEATFNRFVKYPPLRPFFGGVFVVLLFVTLDSNRYAGLGIDVIKEALSMRVGFIDPILKTFATAMTIGSGFKGGEFIPLVFIGATMGSALSLLIPVSGQILAVVGFSSVFAGAAKTPIACSMMAIEIFGVGCAPYVILGCFVSYWSSGPIGIYRSQRR